MPSVNVKVIEDGLKSILVNLQRAYSMTYRLSPEDSKKQVVKFLEESYDDSPSHKSVIESTSKVILTPLRKAIAICKEENAPKTYKLLLEWREKIETRS